MTAPALPYMYTDSDGSRLTIEENTADGPVLTSRRQEDGQYECVSVLVLSKDVPAVASALLKADGWKKPVLIEGLDLDPSKPAQTAIGFMRVDGRDVVLETYCSHCVRTTARKTDLASARNIAAHLVTVAEHAAQEPLPDDVTKLAATMSELHEAADGTGVSVDDQFAAVARQLLRRFNVVERAK